MSKKLRALLSMVLSVVMLSSVVGCGDKGGKDNSTNSTPSESQTDSTVDSSSEDGGEEEVEGKPNLPGLPDEDPNATYTYNTYTAVSPSNWNELTYQDNNDTQIMNYLTSPLFEFDFKYDAEGNIKPGDFNIEYSFATSLTDVSEDFGFDANSGMAWQITIREDGKWNDGTPIVAGDFVYTMKEQLNPLFKNYRADSFYNGATVIKNARNYVFQGETVAVVDNNDVYYVNSLEDLTKGDDGVYAYGDSEIKFAVGAASSWCGGDALADYAGAGYLNEEALASLVALADEAGYVAVTDETIALMGTTIATDAWGETADNWIAYVHVLNYVYPELSFDEVGISAPNDTTIVLELEQPLQLLKEDGSLSYKAAYNMASLPLVKEDLYEANKVAPVEGSELWTSTYHSDVASTASWGPYMLTEFQAGKIYKLEKNPNWYGWNMEKYEGQYQTTHIVCDTIAEWNTAWMAFKKGDISGIGIDVSIATDYKNSEQAYYTPSDYVGSLQLQASAEGLKNRESDGVNKTILLQEDFRKALSLGLNRDTYAKATTTAHLAGFGLYNSMHYYDVANGKAYRESDAAKLVLCAVYGVNPDDYDSLDDAVDSITGYDIQLAKALVDSAYDKAIAAGDLKATDKVVLTYGTSTDNEVTRRYYDNLNAQWQELMKGTKLEGKFELEFNASFGTKWANDFRAGAYDICQGGWTGAAWDPGYFLLAYLSPDYMYSQAWDTANHMLNFTIKGVNAEGVATNNAEDSYTAEHDLLTWYDLLNGDWQSGVLEEDFRLELIAALEKEILVQYYSVPVTYEFSASLISFKVDYTTYEYNTFMGYGGIQYMSYNYSDAQWAEFVAANAVDGELNYK